jgi:hypothetical protein
MAVNMNANRTKPKFGKPEPRESQNKDDPWGCILIPLVVVLSYFVLSAIVRYTSGSGRGLDQIICYGALIVFVIIMLLGAGDMIKESLAIDKEKQRWKKACRFTDVAIVKRSPGGDWDDGYRFHYAHPRLELEMNVDQKAVSPNYTTVSVEIWDSLYKKLETQNSVRIYYKPEAPLTFLLEEEL